MIVRSYVYLDYLDIMRQAGYWPLALSLGQEGVWQHPLTNDGVLLTAQGEATSRRSFDLMLAMQTAMGLYRGGAPTRAALDDDAEHGAGALLAPLDHVVRHGRHRQHARPGQL